MGGREALRVEQAELERAGRQSGAEGDDQVMDPQHAPPHGCHCGHVPLHGFVIAQGAAPLRLPAERARIGGVPCFAGVGLVGRLVIAGSEAYGFRVRYVRALALVCFAFGLFVQVSAQASALPQVQTASGMDCSEMAQSGNNESRMQPSNEGGSCDMTLECLIAMHCIPPMALTDGAPTDAPFSALGTLYQPDGSVRLKGSPIPPESPPPQPALTA